MPITVLPLLQYCLVKQSKISRTKIKNVLSPSESFLLKPNIETVFAQAKQSNNFCFSRTLQKISLSRTQQQFMLKGNIATFLFKPTIATFFAKAEHVNFFERTQQQGLLKSNLVTILAYAENTNIFCLRRTKQQIPF